jgi:SH3-like domain-containing protein
MRFAIALSVLGVALAGPAPAQTAAPTPASAEADGTVTGLPLPRYVSLKTGEGNARRGPSLTHRIDWVFRHRDMPLRVTAEFGNWRRVEDEDGQGGWMHYSLLSGVRTVVIEPALADLHAQPAEDSPVEARAEAGVIGRLGACQPDWCRITVDGARGWVRKTDLWGVDPGELRD